MKQSHSRIKNTIPYSVGFLQNSYTTTLECYHWNCNNQIDPQNFIISSLCNGIYFS